jgi:hypothetical protein
MAGMGLPPKLRSARPHARTVRPAPSSSARAGFASDYIYRGVTLSDRKPAVGAGLEAALGLLYGGATVTSVKLPTQPAAEITMNGGVRPKLWEVQFDFGWTYFLYPGETVPVGVSAGIEYWEAAARADTRIGEALRVAGDHRVGDRQCRDRLP